MNPVGNLKVPTRIWDKLRVEHRTGCWIWTGATACHGRYGNAWNGKRVQMVHRQLYEAKYGPVPKGLVLDHLCRNSLCANFRHLEAVTQHVNILRGESPMAQRARRTHCNSGHELSESNLRIRVTYSRECITCERAKARNRV